MINLSKQEMKGYVEAILPYRKIILAKKNNSSEIEKFIESDEGIHLDYEDNPMMILIGDYINITDMKKITAISKKEFKKKYKEIKNTNI